VKLVLLAHRLEKQELLVQQVCPDLMDPRVVRVKQVLLERQVYKVFTVLRVRLV
jgi:hypothetical protein